MTSDASYSDLKCFLDAIAPAADNFQVNVRQLRERIDQSYKLRSVTLHQWRELMEETAALQGRIAAKRPDKESWIPTSLRPSIPARGK